MQGIMPASGMKIGYVMKSANRWDVELERNALRFDADYYGNLLEKGWEEVAFVFERNLKDR